MEPSRLPLPFSLTDALNRSRSRANPDSSQFFNRDRNVTMMALQKFSDTVAIVVVDGWCFQCFKEERNGEWITGTDVYIYQTDRDHSQHIAAETGLWMTHASLMATLRIGTQQLFEAKQSLDPENRDKFKVARLNIIGDFSDEILADFTDKLVVNEVVFYGLPTIYSILDGIEGVAHVRIQAYDADKAARVIFEHPAVNGAMIKQVGSQKEEQFRMELVGNRRVLKPETTENLLKTWIMQDAPIATFLYVFIISSVAVDQIENVSKNMPGAKHVVNSDVTSSLRGTIFVPFGELSSKWIQIMIYSNAAHFDVVDHNNCLFTVPQSWSKMAIQKIKGLAVLLTPRHVANMLSAVFGYLKAAVQKRLPQLDKKE